MLFKMLIILVCVLGFDLVWLFYLISLLKVWAFCLASVWALVLMSLSLVVEVIWSIL